MALFGLLCIAGSTLASWLLSLTINHLPKWATFAPAVGLGIVSLGALLVGLLALWLAVFGDDSEFRQPGDNA
jgi:hypothetical protein